MWATEMELDNAEMWKRRANVQLDRARKAEEKATELTKKLYRVEGVVPLAAAVTPEEAAAVFCEHQWPGEEVDNVRLEREGVPPKNPDRPLWRVRCHVGGTSMKIDGYELPGGAVVTGWI